MRRAWTGHSRLKAPLVPVRFEAEVDFHGDKCVPLQIMAAKHAEAGYCVKVEEFKKEVPCRPTASVCGKKVVSTKKVDFLRVEINTPQGELDL